MLYALGEWVEAALCRGGTIPEDTWFENANLARQICRKCPVQNDCLEAAKEIHAKGERVEGIWAGLSAVQIKRLADQPSQATLDRMRKVRRKENLTRVVALPARATGD